MKLSEAEVRKVASLARLDLSEQEVERLTHDLSSILTYVEQLAGLDTSAVEPTSHVVEIKMPTREDAITNVPSTEDALANAPRRDENFFVVPSIIE